MTSFVIAASASSDGAIWTDLGEVVLWGLFAGVGLPIAFALAMRGLILGSHARREGHGGAATAQFALGAVFSVVCIAAILFGLVSMLDR